MKISSPFFQHDGNIPAKFTCDGENVNPPLRFSDVPKGTKSMALLVSDPEAIGKRPFYHWVLYNIPANLSYIEENSDLNGTMIGTNDFGRLSYNGPCPPFEMHHYLFTLYALDTLLDFEGRTLGEDVLVKMNGHILETAQLVGLYFRKNK